MNTPVKSLLDRFLTQAGNDSLSLGSASVGLIAAPFSPSPTLLLSSITEANFSGYTRKSIGNPTVAFTGVDGLEYVQGNTLTWIPSSTVTVNTLYGLFLTNGSDTTKLIVSDAFPTPIFFDGPTKQLTITPRFGLNPNNGLGLNVISD